jgi:hypothetical protein
LALGLLEELQVDFHSLTDAIVSDRPSSDNPVVDLTLLYPDYEMSTTVSDSLFEVVEQLLSVLAEVDVDSLSLGLQDSVLIDQDEPHCLLS